MKTRAFYFLFVCALFIAIFSLCPPSLFLYNDNIYKDDVGFSYSYYYDGQDLEEVFDVLTFQLVFKEYVGETVYYYGISPLGRRVLTQNGERYNCQIAVFPDVIKFGFPLA